MPHHSNETDPRSPMGKSPVPPAESGWTDAVPEHVSPSGVQSIALAVETLAAVLPRCGRAIAQVVEEGRSPESLTGTGARELDDELRFARAWVVRALMRGERNSRIEGANVACMAQYRRPGVAS